MEKTISKYEKELVEFLRSDESAKCYLALTQTIKELTEEISDIYDKSYSSKYKKIQKELIKIKRLYNLLKRIEKNK